MSDDTIQMEIFRYNPDTEEKPSFQTYTVPYNEDWVVLDAINHIKDQLDGTLTYRWSCRMGVCGSCGMMINGIPKLTCAAFLRDYYPATIKIEPLQGFPVDRDLVIEFDGFVKKLKSIKPWIIRNEGEERPIEKGEYLQSPAELANFKQYSMCINCMLCYAACPEFAKDEEFIGPAALALAHRYNLDSRDQGRNQRQEEVAKHEGVWGCTFVGECSVVCPKDVDPAGAIQQGKLSSTIDWFKEHLIPGQGSK